MKKYVVLSLLVIAAIIVYWCTRTTSRQGSVETPELEQTSTIIESVAAENVVTNASNGAGKTSAKHKPSQVKNPTSDEIVDYRSAPLPAADKGGYSGELREWILKDKTGMLTHREEEWRHGRTGELECEKVIEYAADRVLVTIDGETEVATFGASDELMELEKGGRILSVTSADKVDFDTVTKLTEELQAKNGKAIVEPDYVQRAFRIPNDPRYRGLWGMEKIGATKAWDQGVDATNVIVAVLDTGVNYFHEDLTDNILRDKGELPFPYVVGYNAIGNVNEPMDDNGHGTHCAGTIAAVGNNGKGVTGITWNANIMPLKFLNSEGSGATSWSISCMNWARQHNADIISCSFGGGGSQAQKLAMERLRIMGSMFACAAGNEGANNDKQPMYPASYDLDNIIAVASSGISDELSRFSNYGEKNVDIAAPGEGILSTYWSYRSSDTAYATLSGTSMATPHVAGAMALLKGYYPDDEPFQTIQRLLLNGQDVESLKGKVSTGKRLDLYGAMLSPIPPAPVVKATEGTLEDRVEINWVPVKGATYYKLYREWSEGDEQLTVLTDWTTDLSYVDTSIEPKVGYHYYVQCSKHEDGHDASPMSYAAVGYMKRPVTDEWDNDDDNPSGATVIVPTDVVQSHGEHTLSEKDAEDWFKITMSKDYTYVFESKGEGDLFAEIFFSPTTNKTERADYDDDGGERNNFKLAFTPTSSGEYYLRVTNRADHNAYYRLDYSIADWHDEWDPADDTFLGATKLTISADEQTHGLHALSAFDKQDVFAFELQAGKTYVFKTTGDSDTYGELYFENSSRGSLVAYNDDGHDAASGSALNFRIVYVAKETGTYYLKVRTARERTSAAYNLVFNEVADAYDFEFTDDDLCASVKGWTKNLILSDDEAATSTKVDFMAGTPLYLKWAFNETSYVRVEEHVKNLVEVYNSYGERIMWGEAVWNGAIQQGAFIDFKTDIPGLPAGAYVIKLTLNSDIDGKPSHGEAERGNNVAEVAFTILDSDSAAKSIAIIGADEVYSKAKEQYRVQATFANGTVAEVSPRWTIVSGIEWATISSSGELTANQVTQDKSVVLRAVYGETYAEKTITILAEASIIESPFGTPVRYPSAGMTINAVVKINGVNAAEGDYLAAFVGSEVRGTAKIGVAGECAIKVNLARNDERISFKVCDVSEESAILACAETVAGLMGGEVGPIEITATTDDPFGTPEAPTVDSDESTKPEKRGKATIYAQVTINGWPAAPGDMLAIYDGTRLAGKGRISLLSSIIGLFQGAAGCTVEVEVIGKKELSFVVWDKSRQKYCTTSTTVTLGPGDKAGSLAKPIKVEVNDKTGIFWWFQNAGWHLMSTGLEPEEPAVATVFAAENISEVKGDDESWTSGEESSMTISSAKGYWIKTAADDVTIEVEGERNEEISISLKLGWNLVGYPLERAGRIEDVLRTALVSGAILEISDETGTYPNGNLTMMYPGRGYWINSAKNCEIVFDSVGMICAAATGENFGPFGSGEDAFKEPIMPVRYTNLALKIGETTAKYGDVAAFYGKTDGKLYALARVETEDGKVSFPVYAAEGTVLHAKLWNAESGLTFPQILEAESISDFTVPAEGMETDGLTVRFSTGATPEGKVVYNVIFDLGEHVTRIGGGELNQSVELGAGASAPEVTAAEGWKFLGWDGPFADVRSSLTIKARVEKIPEEVPPPVVDPSTIKHYTIQYELNGGTGEVPSVEAVVGEATKVPEASDIKREGYTFLGWSPRPSGGMMIDEITGTTENEVVKVFGQWGYNGFKVKAKTVVCNENRAITVPVTFDSSVPLSMINVQVSYDPEIVEIRKVELGTLSRVFTDDFTVAEPKHGLLSISLFAAKDVIPGAGAVANLTFTVRNGAAGHFSDVTIANVQVGELSGVKDLTVEHPIEVENGMIRVAETSADIERLEGAQMIAAGTTLQSVRLMEGDSIQASDEKSPIVVGGSTLTDESTIRVEAPAGGWGEGRYELIKTKNKELAFSLVDCPLDWEILTDELGEETLYVANIIEDYSIEIVADNGDALLPRTRNQIRTLLGNDLPHNITKLTVFGPNKEISLIADMGIAPMLTITGTEATAVYRTPKLSITSFNPETGIVRIKVEPGEGNKIVGYLATGYVHVYGTNDLAKRMSVISKVGFDLTPYLQEETKGEADLTIELGSHTFLKIKIE